jgi:hypothetical protein
VGGFFRREKKSAVRRKVICLEPVLVERRIWLVAREIRQA